MFRLSKGYLIWKLFHFIHIFQPLKFPPSAPVPQNRTGGGHRVHRDINCMFYMLLQSREFALAMTTTTTTMTGVGESGFLKNCNCTATHQQKTEQNGNGIASQPKAHTAGGQIRKPRSKKKCVFVLLLVTTTSPRCTRWEEYINHFFTKFLWRFCEGRGERKIVESSENAMIIKEKGVKSTFKNKIIFKKGKQKLTKKSGKIKIKWILKTSGIDTLWRVWTTEQIEQ